MKKLVWLVLLVFISSCYVGCATTTYKETSIDGVSREVTIKRPIFAATSLAWSTNTGNINSASSVNLEQLVASMLAGYLAAQATPAAKPVVTEVVK